MSKTKLMNAHQVREMLGGVSDMFLWRRLNEPGSTFPRPIILSRRRYWRESDIAAWIEAQAEPAE